MGMLRSWGLRTINSVLRPVGVEINPVGTWEQAWGRPAFPDIEPWVAEIIRQVRPFTATSNERISALCHAARYVARHGIEGDIVECGVWRGGSMMAAAITLLAEGDASRRLHLFDTFEGMTMPGEVDRAILTQQSASSYMDEYTSKGERWYRAALEEVRENIARTTYSMDRVRFIKGKVEETIPDHAPERISLLRLDTDWYESTRHELIHLYPRLVPGGTLIIDDYGHWDGARKAVDEYIEELGIPLLLQRIDYTGRLAIKPG